MNEERLAEIEELSGSMEVSAYDESVMMELIQALRDERAKVAELTNWFDISQNKLMLSEKAIDKLRKEIHGLQRQL